LFKEKEKIPAQERGSKKEKRDSICRKVAQIRRGNSVKGDWDCGGDLKIRRNSPHVDWSVNPKTIN